MAEPSVLQKKTEIFLERDIYPLLKNFPASEKFSLCQEIKQSCYKLIRAAVMANNLTNVNRRLMWLDEADAEKTLLLVLLGVAKNQKYITQKKLLELQGKLEEIGRIIGGLQKFFIVGSNPRHGCQAVLKGKDATNDEIPHYALQHKEHQEGPRAADPSTLQL